MNSTSLLTLRILTPEGVILEVEDLSSITAPLVDHGTIGILPGHAPLIAETTNGNVVYKSGLDVKTISLYPGVLDVNRNFVIIFTAGETKHTSTPAKSKNKGDYTRLMQTLNKDLRSDKTNDSNKTKHG